MLPARAVRVDVVVVAEEREDTDGFEERRSVAEGGRGLVVVDDVEDGKEDVGGAPYRDVGRDLGAAPAVPADDVWLGGRRTVLLFRVATLLARAWPFVGLPVAAAAVVVDVVAGAPARLEDGRPPEVVGLAVVGVDGPEPAPVLPAAALDDETRLRLLVEAFAGYRVRVSPGSLVEDVLVRPESALVLLKGALVGPELADPPPPAPAPAATSLCLVEVDVVADAGWRVEELLLSSDDKGFGLFFLGASEAVVPAAAVLLATLAPETVRVVGRVAARDRGAGSLLGDTGRCDVDADADGGAAAPAVVELAGPLAAVIEAEEDTEVVVVAGGRSVEEPCVGFRRERVRASDEDMTAPGSLDGVWWSCGSGRRWFSPDARWSRWSRRESRSGF